MNALAFNSSSIELRQQAMTQNPMLYVRFATAEMNLLKGVVLRNLFEM